MPAYSEASARRLATCHPDLQAVFNEVIKHFDCTILQGHRTVEQQQDLYAQGRTRPGAIVTQIDGVTKKGMHNHRPALAVDATPYPINWKDRERQTLFAGFVLGVAARMGVKLRWGGDWNQDTQMADNRFDDFPHFELAQ